MMPPSTLQREATSHQCDPEKAEVMRWISGLVGVDLAELRQLKNDEHELRLASGEVFRLRQTTIHRIA
ncbi:hypothetical protein SAMN05421538_1157 [Paracoccus isoporae]|uniref:Uncharacterized protein n=1 Tax=Paracoccus isoporae TaxID=591205 RepID=A0A1G7GUD5_9RHOB|nr:hypothetical protein [Paracoccus isoporae]SDE91721.1 hypothetical protein SAMN05421538_1157 [Paracoccus isoporae]